MNSIITKKKGNLFLFINDNLYVNVLYLDYDNKKKEEKN